MIRILPSVNRAEAPKHTNTKAHSGTEGLQSAGTSSQVLDMVPCSRNAIQKWYWLAHRNIILPTATIVLEIVPAKGLRTLAKRKKRYWQLVANYSTVCQTLNMILQPVTLSRNRVDQF